MRQTIVEKCPSQGQGEIDGAGLGCSYAGIALNPEATSHVDDVDGTCFAQPLDFYRSLGIPSSDRFQQQITY